MKCIFSKPFKTKEEDITAAVLAQSVERVDCRAGGRGFDSIPLHCNRLDPRVARMTR